jgi:hypothetical protein
LAVAFLSFFSEGRYNTPTGFVVVREQKREQRITIAHNAEDGVTFSPVGNGIVNDVVLVSSLVSFCFLHVRKTFLFTAHVNPRQAFVEENLGRIELEFETELFIVAIVPHRRISAERGMPSKVQRRTWTGFL